MEDSQFKEDDDAREDEGTQQPLQRDEEDNQSNAESQILDREIASLESQIKALSHRHQVLQSHLLNTSATRLLLASDVPPEISPLVEAASTHAATNLYRMCTGCTAFRVQDPNPYGVDGGRVLGIRVDINTGGSYITPYYVFLVRPRPETRDLKVHKHTFPQCIPLSELASRYLSQLPAKGADGIQKPAPRPQDLQTFAKTLRLKAVAYHKRLDAIDRLQNSLGLGDNATNSGQRSFDVVDLAAVDSEAYVIRLEWSDGRTGRLTVNEKGVVKKAIVVGETGRQREDERILLGTVDDNRLESLAQKLEKVQNV
ncbi:MAG: hypothetical protein M1814_006688 [Vezdaea aestivalis]|nr:MAG: hypothetical protein M1814_006688 [Vezdaea aestivalis]